MKIKIIKNGPYLVSGKIPLAKEKITEDENGYLLKWEKISDYPKQENHSLCRCGESKNAPFCDGSHKKASCNLTETAIMPLSSLKWKKLKAKSLFCLMFLNFAPAGIFAPEREGYGNW